MVITSFLTFFLLPSLPPPLPQPLYLLPSPLSSSSSPSACPVISLFSRFPSQYLCPFPFPSCSLRLLYNAVIVVRRPKQVRYVEAPKWISGNLLVLPWVTLYFNSQPNIDSFCSIPLYPQNLCSLKPKQDIRKSEKSIGWITILFNWVLLLKQ